MHECAIRRQMSKENNGGKDSSVKTGKFLLIFSDLTSADLGESTIAEAINFVGKKLSVEPGVQLWEKTEYGGQKIF
jgi:hypothetical protein